MDNAPGTMTNNKPSVPCTARAGTFTLRATLHSGHIQFVNHAAWDGRGSGSSPPAPMAAPSCGMRRRERSCPTWRASKPVNHAAWTGKGSGSSLLLRWQRYRVGCPNGRRSLTPQWAQGSSQSRKRGWRGETDRHRQRRRQRHCMGYSSALKTGATTQPLICLSGHKGSVNYAAWMGKESGSSLPAQMATPSCGMRGDWGVAVQSSEGRVGVTSINVVEFPARRGRAGEADVTLLGWQRHGVGREDRRGAVRLCRASGPVNHAAWTGGEAGSSPPAPMVGPSCGIL